MSEERTSRTMPADYGPAYPVAMGATVSKFRSMTRKGGLASLSPSQRYEYGAAVERAILAKQKSELQRELISHVCNCASGTNHNTGADIDRAVKAQQRAKLAAYPSQARRARKPEEWQCLYDAAMAEKRNQKQEREKCLKREPSGSATSIELYPTVRRDRAMPSPTPSCCPSQ